MTTLFEKEVLSHNLALIVQVLRDHHLAKLTIEYAGSGDSGEQFDIAVFDAQGKEGKVPTTALLGKHALRHYGPAPTYALTITCEDATQPRSFADFLEDFHSAVLTTQDRGGYEDNEGGGGMLTIDVSGECLLEHYDFYTARSESTSDLSEFMPELSEAGPEPQRPAIALPAQVNASPYCVEV
jgi:hypothetical protein